MSQDKIQFALKALLLEEAEAKYNLTGNTLVDELIKDLQPSLLQSPDQAKKAREIISNLLQGKRRKPSQKARELLKEELLTALMGLKQLLRVGNTTVVQATLTWHKFKTGEFIDRYIAEEE